MIQSKYAFYHRTRNANMLCPTSSTQPIDGRGRKFSCPGCRIPLLTSSDLWYYRLLVVFAAALRMIVQAIAKSQYLRVHKY